MNYNLAIVYFENKSIIFISQIKVQGANMFGIIQEFFNNNWKIILISIGSLLIGCCFTILAHHINKLKSTPENQTKKRNLFSKIAIAVLFFMMATLVLFSFFGSSYNFSISNGIVYVFCLMFLLLVSDSIETFSIGNIITLRKKIEEREKEVKKLSTENSELRTQIVSIASASITNTNHNQVIVDLSRALKGVNIESATTDDNIEDNSSHEIEEATPPYVDSNSWSGIKRSKFMRLVEKRTIHKFALKNDIDPNLIQSNVKFSEQFTYGNPIMESKLIYAAYLKRPLEELFIETTNFSASILLNYRMYYMISMIVHYAEINNKSAKLILLIPKYPEEWAEKVLPHNNQLRSLERLQNTFQPAIKNGFLEIKVMDFSAEECVSIEKEIDNNSKF